MKKIIFTVSILVVGVWAMSFGGYCELEGEKTHKAAIPVVEALAAYAEKNGIPNLDNFDQVEGIPYELKPCSERPDLMECEVLKDGYYFQIGEDYYTVRMSGIPSREKPIGFGMDISYNYTNCSYTIYKKKALTASYMQPACSLIGRCAGWFRQ